MLAFNAANGPAPPNSPHSHLSAHTELWQQLLAALEQQLTLAMRPRYHATTYSSVGCSLSVPFPYISLHGRATGLSDAHVERIASSRLCATSGTNQPARCESLKESMGNHVEHGVWMLTSRSAACMQAFEQQAGQQAHSKGLSATAAVGGCFKAGRWRGAFSRAACQAASRAGNVGASPGGGAAAAQDRAGRRFRRPREWSHSWERQPW